MADRIDFMASLPTKASAALFAAAVLAVASSSAYGKGMVDDYVNDNAPRALSRAHFAVATTNHGWTTISRKSPRQGDEDGAYFTEDGGISIPPRSMIAFRNAGKCMDPHLPAPAAGEPMQFVNVGKLIPQKLRQTYDTLLERSARGDRKVAANNLQHLVWALRTAGTDDPIANNLSDSQIALLDECAGRRGAFMKFHEREKAKNAKRRRRGGRAGGANQISVGGYSYDAADLRGADAVRRIEEHMTTLTEMGEKATETTESDFRYGEIEDELYSDITCDGGLSFTAKILNASDHRREFRAADFAAQVGNGQVAGSRRQRVTMCPPDEFMVVTGALQEGVEIDRNLSIAEIEGEAHQNVRARNYRRRKARTAEGHSRTSRETERKQRRKTETTTVIEEPVPPVPGVPPVPPVVIRETVTNDVVRNVPVAEDVDVRVVSLEYDAKTGKGVLTLEILRGSFKKASKYIRKNFDDLVRRKSPAEDAAKIPSTAKLEIESISINDDDRCEIKFVSKEKGVY